MIREMCEYVRLRDVSESQGIRKIRRKFFGLQCNIAGVISDGDRK